MDRALQRTMADLLIMLADGVEAAGFLCRESLEVHGPVLSAAPRSQVASAAVVPQARLTTGVTGQISFRPIAHWFVIGGLVMLAVTIYSLYRLVKELQYRKRVKEGLEPRRHSGDARHSGSADSFTRRQSVELGVV